jgi:hypothetical protein
MLFLFHGEPMNTPNINLAELTEQFGTDAKCRKALRATTLAEWPEMPALLSGCHASSDAAA